MLKLNYYIDDSVRNDVYALAELDTDYTFNMSFQHYFQFPPGQDGKEIARQMLEWAISVTGHTEGLVEVSSNKPVHKVMLENYPKLEIKNREAITEMINPVSADTALLG